MFDVGRRVKFTLYDDFLGEGTITGRAGAPSEAYQYFIKLDDGRDFVATEEEVE